MQVQKRQSDTVIEIMELHSFEMELIRQLRNTFKFGEVTIMMKDGLPFRIKRIIEFSDLDK